MSAMKHPNEMSKSPRRTRVYESLGGDEVSQEVEVGAGVQGITSRGWSWSSEFGSDV